MTDIHGDQALLDQALAALANGKLDAAESDFIALRGNGYREDAVLHNLGVIAYQRGRYQEAAEHLERTLHLNPTFAKAHRNLASAYLKLDRPAEALVLCDAAVLINSNDGAAYYKRGLALGSLQRHAEALQAHMHAMALNPGDYYYVLAVAHTSLALNLLQDALVWYGRAFALNPNDVDARFTRASAFLLLGDFERGFEDYELRWHPAVGKARLVEHSVPRWVGQVKLDGKTILIQAEQGLGDAIQFARYAPLLANMGAKVVLQVRPELSTLFEGFQGTTKVHVRGDPLPSFDYYVPMLSLPRACRTTLETIPAAARYLAAPGDRVKHWSDKLGRAQRSRIGIVWSGSPTHKNDNARSMPLASFPIPNPDLFEVFCLQKFVRDSDQAVLDSLPIVQLGEHLNDMADTAAVAELMDLVITVDTGVAHLAAALGRPVWLLLAFNADWRWLHGREDSPWYPTMRIFQQTSAGDWQGVFDRVTAALAVALAAG
jgi:hypothetical protein